MSLTLRILLIVFSILTFLYLMRRIRNSRINLHDTLFWILISFALILMSLFPGAVTWMADIIGIQSASNFVFLGISFLLMIQCFLQTLKISHLETKLNALIQKVAIEEQNARIKGDQTII